MKKAFLILAVMFGVLLVFTGCSGDDDKPFVNDPPTNLRFYIDTDTTAVLTWKASPDANDDNFLYYQIFSSPATFTGVDPSLDTLALTRVMTTTDTSYTISIQRGSRQYYVVKCVLNLTSDARFSARSNEVNLAGVFMGEDTLYQVSPDSTRFSGFAFDATTGGSPYTMTIANSTVVQFYIGSTGTTDGPGSPALKARIFITLPIRQAPLIHSESGNGLILIPLSKQE